jgi:cyclopropane-fatty-acyl-phospholipid synthase
MKDGLTADAITSSRKGRSSSVLDRWAVSVVQRRLGSAPVRLALWDGAGATLHGTPPLGTVVIKDRGTLLNLLRDPHLYFGDAYETGRLEIQGDLVPVLEAMDRGLCEVMQPAAQSRPRTRRSRRAKSVRMSRENIHYHYDIGNDFYELWLDRELVYTCAYYANREMTLEEAQEAKMELVCRKLQLRKGERVVEAGCGWGSLALYMARHHGVSVRAFNISREQIEYARRRADREGLSDRVEFVDEDYRAIEGPYDVFVSVGMLEHVGRPHYRELGEAIDRSIHPERGRGLLHFIGRNQPEPLNAWIKRRIFPGAYPPALREVIGEVLEPWNFTVLDVENLRLHYARTLEHWLERYESSVDQVRAMFDEQFVRAWRLYLAGSQATFQAGCLQLFQIAFARGVTNDIPWTRRDFIWP